MPVNNLIQLRKGDTSAWDADPVLASGEPGFDIEKNILKIGDGSTAWSSLEPVNTALTNFNIYGTGNINISGNITANTGNFDVVSFNTNNESILTKGQISWDDTEGTMDIGLTDNTTIHIGSHRYFRIRNETGGTLYKGQVVYASGVHANGIIEPALYVADGAVREVRFMGVILEDVNHQNNGYAIDFGHLEEMDLDGSAANYAVGDETWVAGDILYVHPTGAGKLTKNEPKHSISVAIVLDPGNGNGNGRMFVRPTSYGHLDDNHDVAVSGATNGQFLQYNSATDYWVPSSSGNFTTLQVNGTLVPTGVGSAGHITYWNNANSLSYDNGQLYWDSINNRLGIGTTTPTANLHVNGGTAKVDGSLYIESGNFYFNTFQNDQSVFILGQNDVWLFYSDAANDRIGIGAYPPAYKLDVSGTVGFSSTVSVPNIGTGVDNSVVVLDSTGKLRTDEIDSRVWGSSLVDGNGTANYVSKWSDSNTLTSGIIYDNGTNVGIGTPSPNGKLDVIGGRTFLAANNEPYSLGVRYIDTGGAVYFGAASSSVTPDAVISNAGGSELIRFATSGNVGIGTSSPAYKLDVVGTGHFDALNINGAFTFPTSDGSANQYLKTDGAGNVSWASVAGGGSTIDGSGVSNYITKWTDSDTLTSGIIYDDGTNVGIGTASPTEKLHVVGDILASGARTVQIYSDAGGFISKKGDGGGWAWSIDAIGSSGTTYNGFGFYGTADTLGYNWIGRSYSDPWVKLTSSSTIINEGGHDYDFRVEGDTDPNLLFIDASTDRVGIGTSSPSYKLDVVGTGNFSQNLLVNGTGVSLNGHIHTISIGTGDVSQLSFNTDQVLNIVGSGGVNISFNDATNTLTISPPTAVTGYEELTSSKDTFSVSPNYRIGTLSVYYNGFRLINGRDFTATNGTSFVLAETGSVGDVVEWVGTT